MPKLIHLLPIINPDNNKDIENAIQILSLKINIKTDKEILFGNEEHLISKTGIDKKLFNTIKKRLVNYYASEIVNGEELLDNYLNEKANLTEIYYSFGNKKIDQLVNGGMKPGEIIELVGSPSVGKTQLCLQLSLNVLLSNINNTILYIDTRGSFSIKRMLDFYYSDTTLKRKNSEDIKDIISRIRHQGVYSYYELFNLLETTMKTIEDTENRDNKYSKILKLIVVNSISSLIFPIMAQNDFTRNSIMCSIAQYFNILSRKYNISILITNFTVGTKYDNLSLLSSGNRQGYLKKKEFYQHQRLCNLRIKESLIGGRHDEHLPGSDHPLSPSNTINMNAPLTQTQIEEITQVIDELNDDFPQSLEINKTTSNSIIRDQKKPSLGNAWTYTPDIQLFITQWSSSSDTLLLSESKAKDDPTVEKNQHQSEDITHDHKRQKLNDYPRGSIDKPLSKIEVVLSHRTNIGQSCVFSIDKNGIN